MKLWYHVFFFNDTATTEIYTLSLHDALPIYRTIFSDPITHLDERAFHRTGHAVKQLKLETAAVDPKLIGQRLSVRNAANIVRSERGGNDRFVLEHNPGE